MATMEVYVDNEEEDDLRISLRNFIWTDEAIKDWTNIWASLWALGFKWEWQPTDKYICEVDGTYKLFTAGYDTPRAGAIPLPQPHVFRQVRVKLLSDFRTAPEIDYTITDINRWLNIHLEKKVKESKE